MLGKVISDLRAFMFVFALLIVMLSQVFSILQLGVGIEELPYKDDGTVDVVAINFKKTGKEYTHVGLWVGNIIWTLRCALGDFGVVDAGKVIDSV